MKNFVDFLVIVLYLVISLSLGVFLSRRLRAKKSEIKNNEEDYFLAGRKIPGWLNGISLAATCMNADVAPTYCGIAVGVGLASCWFYLSRFSIFLLIGGMLFAARWRQLGISTGPEFCSLRYGGMGGRVIRVWLSLFSVFIGMVPWIGAGLLGVHTIYGPVFGIESKAVTLSIILPILILYVWISGYAGVIMMDLLHSGIIVVANLILLFFIMVKFDGPAGLVNAINHSLGSSAAGALNVLPQSGHDVFGPFMVLAWLIVPLIGVGGNVNTEGQRLMSCSNTKEAMKVNVWAEAVMFIMLLIVTLPALAALADHPNLYKANPAQREATYGILLNSYLPVGFLGLALASLGASVMATIGSHLNYSAQTIVNDVYKPIFGNIEQKRAVWLGRVLMIFVMLAGVAVVYWAKSLIQIAVTLVGLFTSVGVLNWAQWWWWRVNIKTWMSAYVCGPILYLAVGYVMKEIPWIGQQFGSSESSALQMQMLQAIFTIMLTTIALLLVTLLTKPGDMQLLKKFYVRANPMGFWGPVRKELEKEYGTEIFEEKPKWLLSGGSLTSAAGAIFLSLGILGLSEIAVAKYIQAFGFIACSIAMGFVFKWLLGWHCTRMEWKLDVSKASKKPAASFEKKHLLSLNKPDVVTAKGE
jgi:Na+/proline symporter